MNRTGIEWTHIFGPGSGFTWNPVVGCTNACPYCYARLQARRHMHNCKLCGEFFPHLHEERLDQPLKRQKPAGIFLGSMCDLWDPHVPQDWRDRIWEVVEACPQHVFWVLTKQGERIEDVDAWAHLPNLWVGATVTDDGELHRLYTCHSFVSFEPLLGRIDIVDGFPGTWLEPPEPDWEPLTSISWVIVGAETGNRKGKVVPEAEWVTDIVDRAEAAGTPVFLKDNLIPVMGEGYVKAHQDWPEAMTTPDTD